MATNNQSAGTSGKLTAALVLGIIGGVFGVISAVLAMILGGVGAAFAAEGAGTVVWLGFAAVFIGVVGIVGGALARGSPKTAALILLLTGVVGFVAISLGWLLAGPILIVGAVLAWFGRTREKTGPRTAAA